MGLGLAICKSIVERHHGELSVSSKTDGGACFQIILPIKATAQQKLPVNHLNVVQVPIS
jgi:signal transduction histidine kinase